MFDIGFWEVSIIGIIMLLVLGPERLPGVARTAGFWLGKFRKTVNQVKTDIKKEMDAADLQDLKDIKDQLQNSTSDLKKSINKAKDEVESQADKLAQVEQSVSSNNDKENDKSVDEDSVTDDPTDFSKVNNSSDNTSKPNTERSV